jgi:heat shock protein HslJ
MTRQSLHLVLTLLLPLALAACGTSSGGGTPVARTAGGPSPLEATWILEAYGDASQPRSVLAGTEVTAEFGTPAGVVRGSAGCNSYSGRYTEPGDRLTITQVVATKKFCTEPVGVMDQETQYLNLLQGAERYRVTDRTLEIFVKDGKLLRFRAR